MIALKELLPKTDLTPSKYNRGQLSGLSTKEEGANPYPYWVCGDLPAIEKNNIKEQGSTALVIGVDGCIFWLNDDTNLDWDTSLTSGSIQPAEGVELKRHFFANSGLPKRTTRFDHIFDFYYNGELIGVLQTGIRSERIDKEGKAAELKVDNALLYRIDWLETVFNAFQDVGFTFKHLSELHIAVDGGNTREQLSKYKRNRSIRKKGKTPKGFMRPFEKNSFDNEKIEVEGYHIGSKDSNKRARIYNKSIEIKERSNKTYILDYWKNNGLSGNDIERFEIVLKRKELLKIKDFDITRVDDYRYLASLLRTSLKNWLQFTRTVKRKGKTYKTDIDLFDWEQLKGELLEKLPTKKPSDIWRAKQAIKTNYRTMLLHDVAPKEVEPAINALCRVYGLDDWWKEKLPFVHLEVMRERKRKERFRLN